MPHFFDYILKHKKIIFFVVFLTTIVGVGITLPSNHAAQAACNAGNVIYGFMCPMVDAISNTYDFMTFTPVKMYLIWGVIWLSDIINLICFYIATGCGNLFVYIMSSLLGDDFTITKNPVFLAAWSIVKNWAIILIFLSLVASALMLILRVWADKARQLIPQIIIIGLLINFSTLVTGLFIDVSNIIMRTLLNSGGTEAADLVLKINHAWNALIWPFSIRAEQGLNQVMFYFSVNLIFDVLYIITAISLLFFAGILVLRYIMLVILFILSPLAFGLKIFPIEQAQKLFGDWWHALLKYSFIGIGAAFFLRLSIQMITLYTWGNVANGDYSALNNFIFHFALVIGFMVYGLRLTMKQAGPIINAIMGAAANIGLAVASGGTSLAAKAGWTTAKGAAKGAYSGAAGAANMTGLSRVKDGAGRGVERVKEAGAGLLERVGWYAPGTKSQMKKENLQNRYAVDDATKKTLGNASLDQLRDHATAQAGLAGKPLTKSQVRLKIAAVQELANRDALKNLTPAQQQAAAQYAIDSGVKADEVVGKMSKEAQADSIRRRLFSAGTRGKIFKSLADKKQLDVLNMTEQINAMTEAAVNGINPEDLVNKMESPTQAQIINDPANLFNAETRGKAVESLMKKKSLHLIDPGRRDQVLEEARKSGVEVEDLERADYHFADYNGSRLRTLGAAQADIDTFQEVSSIPVAQRTAAQTASLTAASASLAPFQTNARGQVIDENIEKMDGDQLRRVDVGDLTFDRVRKLTPAKIRQFGYDPNPARRIQLKTFITAGAPPLIAGGAATGFVLDDEIINQLTLADTARTAGNTARANHHENEAIKLEGIRRAIDLL